MSIRNSLYMGLLASFLATVPASASIIYNLTSVTASGSNFDWKYVAQLSPDQQVGPLTTSGAAAIDEAIVFDFAGLVSATTSNFASGITGINNIIEATSPQASLQNAPDSASISNVRSVITGAVMPTGTTAINLYTIDIISTLGGRGNFVFQSGQALKNVPGDPTNLTVTGNTAMIEGPGATPTVPEPSTYLLLGSSLIGIGFLRRKQRA